MANPMYGQNKADDAGAQAAQRTLPNIVGTDLASDTASITLAPFFAAAYALAKPEGPDPVTNKSQYSYLCSYLS